MTLNRISEIMEAVCGKPKQQTIFETKDFKLIRGGAFKSANQGYLAESQKREWNVLTEGKNVCTYLINEEGEVTPTQEPLRTEDLPAGGIITFSTDVNAVQLANNKFLNFIKQKITTYQQRLTNVSKVKKILMDKDIYAFSLGNFFNGSYQTETPKGKVYFSEKSKSIKIAGIDSETLGQVALAIAREFLQESVLVTDLEKNKTYLVYA